MPPLALPLSVGAGMGGGRQLREMGLPMPLPSSGAGISGPSMLLRADAARSCAAARTAAKLLLPPALASRLAEAGWTTPPPTELLLELRPRLSGRAGDSRPAMMCGESGAGATAGDGDQREWASSLPGTKGAMPCDEQSAHRPRGRVRQRSRALAVAGLPASQDPGLRDRQAPTLALACIVDGGGTPRALEAAARSHCPCRRLFGPALRLLVSHAACCLDSTPGLLRGRGGAHRRRRLQQYRLSSRGRPRRGVLQRSRCGAAAFCSRGISISSGRASYRCAASRQGAQAAAAASSAAKAAGQAASGAALPRLGPRLHSGCRRGGAGVRRLVIDVGLQPGEGALQVRFPSHGFSASGGRARARARAALLAGMV